MNNYYKLSTKAEKQYRINSKKAKKRNFPTEIVERRYNAYIDVSRDIYYFSDVDFEAAFGACIITVADNVISNIRWTNDSHHAKMDYRERRSLPESYMKYGLTRSGERLADMKLYDEESVIIAAQLNPCIDVEKTSDGYFGTFKNEYNPKRFEYYFESDEKFENIHMYHIFDHGEGIDERECVISDEKKKLIIGHCLLQKHKETEKEAKTKLNEEEL